MENKMYAEYYDELNRKEKERMKKYDGEKIELEGDKSDEDDFSVCTVCFDGTFEDDNPIIFCDHCNVGIHRYCYGVQKLSLCYHFMCFCLCFVCVLFCFVLCRSRPVCRYF